MLDNVLNTLERGAKLARTRGEAVAQAARLRLEIFGLNREQGALYGRLGRAYHGGADANVLGPIQDEIRRLDGEISERERLIEELGAPAPAATPTELSQSEWVGPRVLEAGRPEATPESAKETSDDER